MIKSKPIILVEVSKHLFILFFIILEIPIVFLVILRQVNIGEDRICLKVQQY